MDTLRGNFAALDTSDLGPGIGAHDSEVEDAIDEAPPPAIGTDERRMQVRAYNFWASLLDNRNFPAIEDLDPESLPDFGPYSVLLDFSRGIEDPQVAFLGARLAAECEGGESAINRLSDVPARSLLSRITDHYMQIIANQAPIGFEAEFVNRAGATVLYRGILLPFSSDDETIDFIYGVINWKELVVEALADELLLEIDQAIEAPPATPHHTQQDDITDWADGPSAEDRLVEEPEAGEPSMLVDSVALSAHDFSWDDLPGTISDDSVAASPTDSLADALAMAREFARAAGSSEDRTRAALYEAVSRAYDFALAADGAPQDFAGLLADAGLAAQERAPMTPVVKLVFGADYDKTRLTEYAAVLAWAKRNGVPAGALAETLGLAEGGLKGIVAAERSFRRGADGAAPAARRTGPRKAIARKLRALETQGFDALDTAGEEFALVMIRRTDAGEVVMLGEVPEDAGLVEKAARALLG